jgi:hypothetical protein
LGSEIGAVINLDPPEISEHPRYFGVRNRVERAVMHVNYFAKAVHSDNYSKCLTNSQTKRVTVPTLGDISANVHMILFA